MIRSKRLTIKTGFLLIVSRVNEGVVMPAFFAKVRATASHFSISNSSSFLGNFAIARLPFLSSTEDLGRAPPRDEPGAKSSFRSAEFSLSSINLSEAARSFGKSISGGMECLSFGLRNSPSIIPLFRGIESLR